MGSLHTKEWLEKNEDHLQDWQKEVFHYFRKTVADTENTYPCILGRQGFLSNHMQFGFIGDPRKDCSILELATVLQEYGKISRSMGSYTSLIAFFYTPQEMVEAFSTQDYEDLFWSVLNAVTQKDPKSWPEEIPMDPSHYSWEFCFDNEPYFAFCSTPTHKSRKSRYFPSFMITFQPRWVFEGINDSTTFGRTIKGQIRKRLEEYYLISPHPDLKWYGQEDNREWKQYFLRDDQTSLSKCPFHKKH
jgi:FPC/CPF motif-containing protein YcgG